MEIFTMPDFNRHLPSLLLFIVVSLVLLISSEAALLGTETDVKGPRVERLYGDAKKGLDRDGKGSLTSDPSTSTSEICNLQDSSRCGPQEPLTSLEQNSVGEIEYGQVSTSSGNLIRTDERSEREILQEVRRQASQSFYPWQDPRNVELFKKTKIEDMLSKSHISSEMAKMDPHQNTPLTDETRSYWFLIKWEWDSWSDLIRKCFLTWWSEYWGPRWFERRWRQISFKKQRVSSDQVIWWSHAQLLSWIETGCNWIHIVKVGDILHLDQPTFPNSLHPLQRQTLILRLKQIFISEIVGSYQPHALRWGLSDGSRIFMSQFKDYHSRLTQLLDPINTRQRFLQELNNDRLELWPHWNDPILITLWSHQGISSYPMQRFGAAIRYAKFGIEALPLQSSSIAWRRLSEILDPSLDSKLELQAVKDWYSELLGQRAFEHAMRSMRQLFRALGLRLLKYKWWRTPDGVVGRPHVQAPFPSTSKILSQLLYTSWTTQRRREFLNNRSVNIL